MMLTRRELAFTCNIVLLVALLLPQSDCLHATGVWSPSANFIKSVSSYGFQKSDIHHKEDTYGYIYGNVTLIQANNNNKSSLRNAALVLVDRNLFTQINNAYNEFEHNKTNVCAKIMGAIDTVAYDERCTDDNSLDIIRYVPCAAGSVCDGAIQTSKIVQNSQFTFVIEDLKQPTFYILLLLACYRDFSVSNNTRNISCKWHEASDDNSVIKYDIWFVNGHPNGASNKPLDFDHQFSFEQQDLLLYLLLIIFYVILTSAQLYAFSTQKSRNLLTYLFTISLSTHCLSFFFVVLHKIVFAHDGQGYEILNTCADIIMILSLAIFILFVLIIAKGWPVTRNEISAKPLLFIAWLLYIIIEIALFIWIRHSVDAIREIDEYHTIPGWISLGFRVMLMMWFLYELRTTMMLEQDHKRLKFYLHFGAGILVWFVHLPLVAIVALQIELMWRYKLITGFSSSANFLAFAIVTHLLWPTRQNRFLTHQTDIDYTEELEYYDDSITSSETYNFSNSNYRANHAQNGYAYDNHLHCDNNIKA